ncbi:MAG: hypothetical protein A2Z72_08770 [Omnitrophica bacterium RBG_13_46_9]|nr:MAG: hypothetical protein A2Z72_08770 [Omnitrophica bacterium RBG_13_46_9]
MLNKEQQQFIRQNIDKMSPEEISEKLGIRAKKLRKEIKKLDLKTVRRKPQALTAPAYKPASICPENRNKILGAALLVFLITFMVYMNTLKNDFIWDDEYLILKNSQVKSFSHFWNVFRTYLGYGSDNINNFYRPMQEISNMVDYFLWGEDPKGFHFTNIMLHSFVAVMVFIFIFYICNSVPIAGLCGIFFGIHPVHTEAVAYIAGRADSLYSAFFLLSFTLLIRYMNSLCRDRERGNLFVLSILLFVPALLSKEISLVLPLLVIVYVFILLKGRISMGTYRKAMNLWIPYAAVVLVYGVLRFTVINFFKIAPPTTFSVIPLPNRLFTFFKTILEYFGMLLVPVNLHMERTVHITRSFFEPDSLLAIFVVLGILAAGVALYRKNRLISFFIFWFFINLLPVSNIFPINSFIAEHWLYMASIGYFFIVSAGIYALYAKSRRGLAGKALAVMLVGAFLSPYAFLTVRRNRDWKDEITFFDNTLKYTPKNTRLYLNLGNTYFEKRQYDKAIEQYEKVISIDENYAVAYGNIGVAYVSKGNLSEAEKFLKKAVALDHNYPLAHYSLGSLYRKTGRAKEAIDELEISVKQLPQYYPSLNLLGELYLNQDDKKRAIELFQRSLQVMPDQPHIRSLLERASR